MRETQLSSINLRLIAYTHSLSLIPCPDSFFSLSLTHRHTHTHSVQLSLSLSLFFSLSLTRSALLFLSLSIYIYIYIYISFYLSAFLSQSPCLPSFIFSVTCVYVCPPPPPPHLTTLSRYVTHSQPALYISLQCNAARRSDKGSGKSRPPGSVCSCACSCTELYKPVFHTCTTSSGVDWCTELLADHLICESTAFQC